MPKISILALALLVANFCLADDWVCREVSSKREAHAILACGIGQAPTEAAAREEALRRAKAEFAGVCESSADCRGHETVLNPLRTECEHQANGFQCWRAIRVEILEQKIVAAPVVTPGAGPSDRQPASVEPAPETTVVTGKLVDSSKQKHFGLGAKIGAASATLEGGAFPGYLAIPLFLEWKWGRVGLRLGVELDSAGAKDSDLAGQRMSGWQGIVALPIYLIDLTDHALVLYPQTRLSKQTYAPPGSTGALETSYWQTGVGGGLEYRLSLGSVVRLVVGADAIQFGDDSGFKGRTSVGGNAGILLFL